MSDLLYFPTLYEDELWYSALCRYFVRSGYTKHATVVHELFERETVSLNTCFANCEFYGIFNRLPEIFDISEIINKHTLIPYASRFMSKEQRKNIYDYALKGKEVSHIASSLSQWTPKEAYLRYCPLCVKEDVEQYGETYWHNSHQVQIMPVCIKHSCLLKNSLIQLKHTKQAFIAADTNNCNIKNVTYNTEPWHEALSKTLYALLYDDFNYGFNPATVFQNKLRELHYFSDSSNKVNVSTLLPDMQQYYGKDLFETIFSQKWFNTIIYKMTRKEQPVSIEKYALLSSFLQIDEHQLTGNANGEITDLEAKLRAFEMSGCIYSKKWIAEQLDVPVYSLDTIAERYNISTFWNTTSKGKVSGKHRTPQISVKVYLSSEEKAEWEEKRKALGISSMSEFIKWIVRQSK